MKGSNVVQEIFVWGKKFSKKEMGKKELDEPGKISIMVGMKNLGMARAQAI